MTSVENNTSSTQNAKDNRKVVVNEWTTKDQELWEQFCDGGMFEMWGYNISGTHPLKAPFLLYKEMMKEVEDREEDDDDDDDEREFPFFVSVAYFPDTNYRFEREVDEFKTMEEAKVCFDAVVVELKNHNDPRVVTLEKWELGDNGAEVLESEDFNYEEEEKKYLVTDITFDDDEDGIMMEEDWDWVKKEVYKTTWFALNEDDLCDELTEKTGWLVAGFECKEIC